MARVVFAELADSDLDFVIAEMAAMGGSQVARKYQRNFRKLIDRLASHPQSGAPRRWLGKGIRIAVVSPYAVVYRFSPANETVTVLRVVHGRRRIGRAMIPTTGR